jgi:hypothetical protein
MIHICDWWATFAGLAGYTATSYMVDPRSKDEERHGRSIPARVKRVDSLDMWSYISGSRSSSPRTGVVTSLNAKEGKAGGVIAGVNGRWKLVIGEQLDASIPSATTPDEADSYDWIPPKRQDGKVFKTYQSPMDCGHGCLFDLRNDPSELVDLRWSMKHRKVLWELQTMLNNTRATGLFQAHTIGGDDKALARKAARANDDFWSPWQEELPDLSYLGLKVNGSRMDGPETGLYPGLPAASECKKKCAEFEKCKAWSYQGIPQSKKTGESVCALFKWLKEGQFLEEKYGWISGVASKDLLPPAVDPPPPPTIEPDSRRRRRQASRTSRRRRVPPMRRRRRANSTSGRRAVKSE